MDRSKVRVGTDFEGVADFVSLQRALAGCRKADGVNYRVADFRMKTIWLPKTHTDPNMRLEKPNGLNSLRC